MVENDTLSLLWLRRLSYMSEKGMDNLAKKNLLSGVKQAKLNRCVHCLAGKQKIVSFKSHPPSRNLDLLKLVCSDLCSPFKVKSHGGAVYFVTFIDDYSRNLWVFSLNSKNQVLDVIKNF